MMTYEKQRALEILTSENSPATMQLEEITEAIGGDIEATRRILIDLQDEELVLMRNGWYRPSAVALNQAG